MRNERMEDIQRRLNAIHEDCILLLNKDLGNSSATLYHYTNLDAAIKILESGKIRFTDARFCNDPNELREGLSILRNAHLKIRPTIKDSSPMLLFFMDALLLTLVSTHSIEGQNDSELEIIYKELSDSEIGRYFLEDVPKTSVYIACFSEHSDNLRQWIPYANGGAGVAIGFKGVNNSHDITGLETNIIRVSYKSIEDKEEYTLKFYNEVIKIFPEIDEDLYGDFFAYLHHLISYDIIACKSGSYHDEAEWRLVHICTNDSQLKNTSFFNHNGIIKPYIDIPINKDSILNLVLGPKTINQFNKFSLSKIARKFGYKFLLSDSEIKYR